MACPWPFLANVDTMVNTAAKPPEFGKSFAQALSNSGEIQLSQMPTKVVMGNSVRVKISQDEYEFGIVDCRCNLHGRLTLNKGDSPLTAQSLKQKLNNLWPNLHNWNLTPLGKGVFEFNFSSIEDMRKIWALSVVHLKPGLLRFSCWTRFQASCTGTNSCSDMGAIDAFASGILEEEDTLRDCFRLRYSSFH